MSFGTQSKSGSRYLERLLSVSETCRLQNRNVYEYLIKAMEAKFASRPAPSLLHHVSMALAALNLSKQAR
ncbi:MAG: hypothetical protein EA381_02380, partial [Planctomycetaceae bacterium]